MRSCALLALVVVLSVAPFADRAVFMDEHLFLNLAQNARVNPLFPSDTPGIFFGVETPNFAGHTHPPVGEYFLTLLYTIFGEFNETSFRLGFCVFAIASAIAFYFLARRFTAEPLAVALLFAVSPAFFVIAPTLMMDMPMMAFLLSGFALYFSRKLTSAAACLVLAVGTGYSALVPIGCLLLVLIIGRRPMKEILCVLAAPGALMLWLAAMTVHYGKVPLIETAEYLRQSPFQNILATLTFLGGVCLCPGVIRLKGKPLAAAFAAASALSLVAPLPTVAARIWFAVLAACGLMLLATLVKSMLRLVSSTTNSGEAVFILWVPAVLLFFIVVADMINARYILLSLPAIYLVVFRETTRRQLIPAIAATAALSIVLSYADSSLASSYRDWAARTVPPLQQQGFRVWNAAESGLRFYIERTGASTLSSKDVRPVGPDLIVRHNGGLVPFRYGLSDDVEVVLTVLKEFEFRSEFPIRTYNKAAGAGFHDSGAGLLPFMFSREPLDRIEVAQVSPFVQRIPQGSTDPEQVASWSPEGPILKESQAEHAFPMKIPSNIQIQYELDGAGRVETTNTGFTLVNTNGATIVWHRFRIMPLQFLENLF